MSNDKNYDVGVVGLGVAGAFAALKIVHNNKNVKTLLVEAGCRSRKRRPQMFSFLGLFPNSNGQLYTSDLQKVEELTTKSKTKLAFDWFKKNTEEMINFKIIKDKKPLVSVIKNIAKAGFDIKLNDYIQLFPSEIHNLSKFVSDQIEEKSNITSIYNTDVDKITKENGMFNLTIGEDIFKCKKIILCIGRSGWRQAHEIFNQFGIIENNDYADIGIRVEMDDSLMKDFNHSHCSMSKNGLSIGPLSFSGTVIPEDHVDMVISAFRSNESRWLSNKVSFNLLSRRLFKDEAVEQISRIGQLTFLLTNDRVAKEKISTLINKKSKLSIMPEYDWLADSIRQVSSFMPEVINKGHFHFPTMLPITSKVKLNKSLETEVDGLYLAGETGQISGLLGSAVSGVIVGTELCK